MAKAQLSTWVMSFLLNTVVIIAIILFIPGIPPYIKFQSYRVSPPVKLEGKLLPTNILDKSELVVVNKIFHGAASIVQRKGEVFTGIFGGEIIRIKNGIVKTIAQIGENCDGNWEEQRCESTKSIRFDQIGKLVVADSYYGILSVDVNTGNVETLVSTSKLINGKESMLPNDLDVGQDGVVYWSDGSTSTTSINKAVEYLGQNTGRLLSYNPSTNSTTILLDELHFPTGVQLGLDENYVFICESMRSKVWKYYLKGEKKGQSEIFVDGLPGLPKNIRKSKSGYFISLPVTRDEENPSFADILGRLPLIRKLILRIQGLFHLFFSSLYEMFPWNSLIWRTMVYIGNLGPFDAFEGSASVIIEVDENGNMLRALQTDKLKSINEASVGEKYTYFGTMQSSKLYRIRNEFLFHAKR